MTPEQLAQIRTHRQQASASWDTPRDESWDSAYVPYRFWHWAMMEAGESIDWLASEVERLRAALDELVGIVNAHRRARGSDCCGCCDVVVNRIEERMFDWV